MTVAVKEFQQKVLPPEFYPATGPFAAGTYLWGYAINRGSPSWPSQTIEARQNTATTVEYSNDLPSTPVLQQFLTVDLTIHWADPSHVSANNHCIQGDENGGDFFTPTADLAGNDAGVIGGTENAVSTACAQPGVGPVPTVPHLHGGEVLSRYDGNPDSWFTQGNTITGPGFVTTTYNYPNRQEATTLWFHDHALGVVRLNVFAGLAGFYFIRDTRDTGLPNNAITLPVGEFEQEIVIQDRIFDTNGQLVFPDGQIPGYEGGPDNPNLHPYAIPEFFGDVITVNGQSWPYLEVQPRRYRFRFLDGSNARFLQMQLFEEATTEGVFNGISSLLTDKRNPPVGIAGPPIWQIGSDGGLLNNPVNVDLITPGVPATGDPNSPHLFMAPAERSDVIIDFGGQAGKRFVLTNTAVTPYPGGGVIVETLPPPAQQGPTADNPNRPGPYEITDQIMEFRVGPPLLETDTSFNPAGRHPALRASPIVDIKPADTRRPVEVRRQLILDEVEDVTTGAPVEVIIENAHWNGNREGTTTPIPGSVSNDGVSATEVPRVGATELWEIANLSPDTHPLHIHLVEFQVIDTQPFSTETDLCPHIAASPAPNGLPQFGDDGDGRFDFSSGPEYRAAWDALFPGGTFNGFKFDPGNFIPGYGPPRPYLMANADGAIGGNLEFSASHNEFFVGPAVAPQPRDQGWKDTIKMFPCGVTRLAVRWAPQDVPADATHAGTNYFPFDPTTDGPGYVWHCHILDHEDNEMMRPILIAK